MKKIIFDLDGTLWETGKSYVYSYNKTCRQLNIPSDKIQDDKFVLSYLGMKLDELVLTIIPEVPDKRQLGELLLANAIEYLVNNPETNSKDIKNLFSKLSEQYEIYIISNCPRFFLDAFYTVSGVKAFVTGDNTIEDSDKIDALKKITENYTQKALFVGDAPSDYEAIQNHKKVSFIYAAYGYKNCSEYNYYLEQLDDIPELLEEIQSMENILEKSEYEVICNKGSYAALIQKENCNYFGFMKVKNPEDFDQVLNQLKEKTGGRTLYGPINGNSWFNYRLVLNEFGFTLYPDCYGNQQVLDKFLSKGFVVCENYASTLTKLNHNIWKKPKAKQTPSDYEFKVVKGKDCNQYLAQIFEISDRCFSDHVFYEKIDFEVFQTMYEKILTSCSPLLILVLYKGKVAGFNFGYSDPENRFFIDKTFAIDKEHRKIQVLKKIIQLTSQQIEELGFDEILFHFQNSSLKTMQSYFKGSILKQKKYGVLKYEGNE